MSKYLPNWKPGDEICIIFADKNEELKSELDEPRNPQEIDDFFDSLKALAKSQNFELSVYGLRPSFEKSIGKTLTRDQIRDIVAERDKQFIQLNPDNKNLLEKMPPVNLTEIYTNGENKV